MIPTIADVKNYWNNRPCNIKHSDKEIGTKEYFDEVEKRKYFVEPHIPKFAEFEKWKGKKVLEIGCGIGTDAINFVRAGAIYTGIELSKESLEITKSRFKVFNYNYENNKIIKLLEMNAENLDNYFDENVFDLVYSFGVIHHSVCPNTIFKQIYRVLKPDGEMRIMLYATDSWKSKMIEIGLDQPEAQYGCPIAKTYTKEDIRMILLDNFKEITIAQDHIFPYKVEKYKNYEYEFEDWFEYMPRSMFRKLEKEMGWHLLITAKK